MRSVTSSLCKILEFQRIFTGHNFFSDFLSLLFNFVGNVSSSNVSFTAEFLNLFLFRNDDFFVFIRKS